jgi:hypothetical protein
MVEEISNLASEGPMTRIVFVALTLWMLAANFAQAQMMMMSQQELKLPDAQDCPIEKPFSPQPEKIESTSEGTRIVYPMDGYVIRRIEFKGVQAPTDIEINWVPRDDPETWGTTSAQLSIKSSDECHFNWFFAPGNVPAKQIEVRSRRQISGLTVLFSDKTWDHEGNCSAKELCPKLVSTSKQCEERPNSNACGTFLSLFKKLTESEQCRRSGDFSPVPGAWVCDELQQSAVMEGSINTLKRLRKLRNATATSFYASQEFRGILDGYLLEEYLDGRDEPKPTPSNDTRPKKIAKWRDNEKAPLNSGYTELSGSDAVRFLTGNSVIIKSTDTPRSWRTFPEDTTNLYYFADRRTAYECSGDDCWTSRWKVDDKDVCFESPLQFCDEPEHKTWTAPRIFEAPHSNKGTGKIGVYLTNKFIMHSVVRGNVTIAPLFDANGTGKMTEVNAKDFAQEIEASSKFSGGDQKVPIVGRRAIAFLIGNTFISDETVTDDQGNIRLCPKQGLYYSPDGRVITFDCDHNNDRWSMHITHWKSSSSGLCSGDGTFGCGDRFATVYLTPSNKKDVWFVMTEQAYPDKRVLAHEGNIFNFK